jgi:hypothetical protein
MPLIKLLFKSGINRENTRYTTEGGFYECDKIRFRQGTPEKIGGWIPFATSTFLGVCRSLWAWITLSYLTLIGAGTNLKYYINRGAAYYDITPIRDAVTLTNPFTATNGSSVITVTDNDHGCRNGDFVTYNGASSLGGAITAAVLNQEYQISFVNVNTYTINVGVTATAGDTNNGGTVRAVYQVNTGPAFAVPQVGWGAGPWGYGTWGFGLASSDALRLWNQSNYGQDLIFGPRGGGIYYWFADIGVTPVSVTISVASPAVVTVTSEVIVEFMPLTFSTTGALPTGLTTGTVYYVRNPATVLGVTTFNLSTTPLGALVNTSGAGSGSQYISPRAQNLASLDGASDVPVVHL